MHRTQRAAACAAILVLTLAVPSARAQESSPPAGEPQAQAADNADKDPYQGVTLQGGQPPNVPPPPPGYQNVTWTGFKPGPQGSEVFLQLSGPISYKEKLKGSRVQITLDKVKIPLKNNLRPVVTGSFPDTPVTRFVLRRLPRGRAQLEIALRRPVTPTVELKTLGQYTYLVISFPPVAAPVE